MLRHYYAWKQKLAVILVVALVLGSFTNMVAPRKAAAADALSLIASYDFDNTGGLGFTDARGGSVLTEVEATTTHGNDNQSFGATSTGATYWQWDTAKPRGGGFTVDVNSDISTNYSIGVRFSYDSISTGYTKIMDYKDKTADTGFYFLNGKLKFYNQGATGSTTIHDGDIVDIVATRNSADKKFIAYVVVNGELKEEINVTDSGNQAVPALKDGKPRFGFFFDDTASAGAEAATGGKVYSVKVWNGPISQQQVQVAMNTGDPDLKLMEPVTREYRQGDGEVRLAPNTTITGGGTYSDGNLTFAIENGNDPSKKGSTTSEKLSLVQSPAALTAPAGAVSIVGDKVYLADGTAAKQIGSINKTKNGVGKDLQIDFATPLNNGDFSSGTTGWTINNKAVTLGAALAPKTQGKTVTVTGSSKPYTVSGTYTVAGTTYNYSFPTDIKYSGAYGLNEGQERVGTTSGSFVSGIDAGALKLESKSISLKSGSNKNNAYGSIFGPEAISSPFTAKQGEQLAFDWKAQGGADNYEIYGYLVDVNGNHTELMYGRGGTQAWTKASGEIPADGTYRFRFVAGSYDQSGGYALGAALFIDNVRVLNNDVTAAVVADIAKLVTYENSPLPKPINESNNLRKITATIVNAQGQTDSDFMHVKLLADAISGAPGGVTGAAVWLKADDGATATGQGQLSGWADKTGNHVFTLETANKLVVDPDGANFYPAVVFSGGMLQSQYGVAIKEAFAVGKHSNMTGDAALAAPKNSGTWNSLFRGNSGGTFSQFIKSNGQVGLSLSNGTLNSDNSLNLLSASAPVGKAWANGVLGERKVPGFDDVDSRQLLVGARSDGNARMQGPVAELIIYENALENWDRLKVNSYLALKYGLTLKTEDGNATNYAASDATNLTNGTQMWTAGKNIGYGDRITGIGRDDNGSLHQKQSKSQENGGLVAIALGNDVKTTAQDNTFSVSRNMSFFTFSDDNASADYNKLISTPQAGNNLKLMDRVFKADKTNWPNTEITLQLGNGGQSDLTYLVIGSEPTFKNAPAAFIPLDADGKVTINTVNLGDGEYFSFAHVNRDVLQEKVAAVAELNPADYTATSWLAMQNALNNANTVLSNPASTQAEIDAALAALEVARLGLLSTSATVNPGGVSGASLWLKGDGGATADSGVLTGWADQTGKNVFTVHGTPDYKQGNANFNPAITFENTSSNTQNPNEYLKGNTAITYKSGYAVFKQRAGTVVGSAQPASNYGTALFSQWAGKLWTGNGANSTYHGFAFNGASKYNLAGFDSSNSASPLGRLNGAGQTVQKNNAFGQINFTPVIGGTFGGGNSMNWDHYKGEIAEVILFPNSTTAKDQQKVESYLALKYGMTLNNGGTDYLASNGISTMWTTAANQGYGKRITGIGRDDGSALLQKQSKSQDAGALVTIAQGGVIAQSVQDNTSTIDSNLSFLTFSDNGANAAFTHTVSEAVYYGLNMNSMDRTFKVEKTNWQDSTVTLKLDGADAANNSLLEQYYLLVGTDASFSAPQFFDLNADGEVNIDSSVLANGSYFTFAKTHKDVLKAKTGSIASLNNNDGRYTTATWNALQDALNAAQSVLNNPQATQYQIDDALDYLLTAWGELDSTKPPLKNKIDDIAAKTAPGTGNLNEPDYTARSWSVLAATYGVAQAVYGDIPQNPAVTYGAALSALELAELGLIDLRPLKAERTLADNTLTAANAASTPGPYTAASWQTLQDALAKANTVLANATNPNIEVTQAEVDAAKAAVAAARAGLQFIDKAPLQEAKNRILAEGLVERNFTPASWAALQTALTNATAVLADPNATEAQVSAALDALIAARDALIAVSNGGDGGNVNPGPGSGIGSGGAEASTKKEKITVDIESGGDKPAAVTKLDIERTTYSDGRIIDHAILNKEKAQEAADKAIQNGEHLARIVIPDPADKVSEVKVDVPQDALAVLQKNAIDWELSTANASIRVPAESLKGLTESFYFRLVPVKNGDERKKVEERAQQDAKVRQFAGKDKIEAVARPLTVDTNLTNRSAILTLPLKDVKLPSDPQEREAFLKNLAVFVEHGDGNNEVVTGKVVTLADNTLGLQIEVDKFSKLSTFTIIHKVKEAQTHIHYINGYPDGLIRPDGSASRAEIATMLINLGAAKDATAKDGFTDVKDNHWAAQAIKLAKAAGLMSGYPDGNFQPGGTITRAEMSAIVFNYLALSKTNHASFTDVGTGHWASQMIAAVQAAGLISGYPDGTFQPEKEITRAEVVTILNRLFHRGPLYNITAPSWPDLNEKHWAFHEMEEASRDHSSTVREEGGEALVSH
ncbi:S-layer homology domain-containing protein [Paenibacillus eucommiae]|uniref:SLH domain-containing protein n=1 Tax=Paenibacillus eucommiae TaxID=1355755 RepID=A0ABS4IP18_9BACL|nr:S-layer homology domain-containing protein [Paenibacillus eucommiae]MBP1988786.1 hypothetical protein [Paenibacillus eucommiae]